MATRTRDQFDSTRLVQKKIFQSGSQLMDADLNEEIDIVLDRYRATLSSVCNGGDRRFDDGFKVVGTGASLEVTIKAGTAAFHLSDGRAVLLAHPAETTLSGFSSWVSSGARTDLIYIDIGEAEVTAASDANLVNPAVGVETCTDVRLSYEIKIAEDTDALPAAASGHVHRELARITKNGTSDLIANDEIKLTLAHFRGDALGSLEVPVWQPVSYAFDGNEPVNIDSDSMTFRSGVSSVNISLPVLKLPYVHNPEYHYLAIHADAYCGTTEASKNLITIGAAQNYDPPYIPEGAVVVPHSTAAATFTAYMDLANATEGQLYTIEVRLKVFGEGAQLYMRRPVITAGLGAYPGQRPLNLGEI